MTRAFAGTISSGWTTWEASLKFPGLPLFPAFAAWPSSVALPTLGLPVPLIALVMDPRPFEFSNLLGRLRAAVGARVNEEGAATAIDRFALLFSERFGLFCAGTILQIKGRGPVPSFAPPYVPAGPVVGGDNVPGPGLFPAGLSL